MMTTPMKLHGYVSFNPDPDDDFWEEDSSQFLMSLSKENRERVEALGVGGSNITIIDEQSVHFVVWRDVDGLHCVESPK